MARCYQKTAQRHGTTTVIPSVAIVFGMAVLPGNNLRVGKLRDDASLYRSTDYQKFKFELLLLPSLRLTEHSEQKAERKINATFGFHARSLVQESHDSQTGARRVLLHQRSRQRQQIFCRPLLMLRAEFRLLYLIDAGMLAHMRSILARKIRRRGFPRISKVAFTAPFIRALLSRIEAILVCCRQANHDADFDD